MKTRFFHSLAVGHVCCIDYPAGLTSPNISPHLVSVTSHPQALQTTLSRKQTPVVEGLVVFVCVPVGGNVLSSISEWIRGNLEGKYSLEAIG